MLRDVLTALGYSLPGLSLAPFLLLTVAIGGGGAWRTGQAVAERWGAAWPVLAYTAALAAAVRFLHYALFGANLLSLPSYLIDFAILAAVALLAHRVRRARQLAEQYPWLFVRSGPFAWRDRG